MLACDTGAGSGAVAPFGVVCGLGVWGPGASEAQALTPQQAHAIAVGDTDDRLKALQEAAARGDAALGDFLKALEDGEVKANASQAFVVRGSSVRVAGGAALAVLPADAQEALINKPAAQRHFGGSVGPEPVVRGPGGAHPGHPSAHHRGR